MTSKNDYHDKPFEIIVDQKQHEWPKPSITGLEIKELAGVDPNTYDAWQDVPGPEDVPIKNDDSVDLDKPGEKRFFTGKKTTTEG